MIYVTHDQVEAMTMADKIVVLQAGRVEQVGSPLELYHHPANLFVAGFIGSPRMNLLPAQGGRAGGDRNDGCALPSGARITVPAGPGRAAGRPGDARHPAGGLRLDPTGPLAGEVRLVERLGGLTLLHVERRGRAGHDGADRGQRRRPGAHDQIRLAVDPAACHLFDEAGQALPQLARHPLAA